VAVIAAVRDVEADLVQPRRPFHSSAQCGMSPRAAACGTPIAATNF
jgi:hypothetical protein